MTEIEKIVLIEPRPPYVHEFSMAKLPRLGLPLLGAILKDSGYQVKIFCEELSPLDWGEALTADLVGISTLTSSAPRGYEIAREIKKQNSDIPIVMGGPHVTFLPGEALSNGADYVVRKEGEKTLLALVRSIEDEKEPREVKGLSYQGGDGKFRHTTDRPFIKDLDSLPHPDLTLIEGHEKLKLIPIQTTRGCPHNCEFCQVVKMFGRGYRKRSVEDVLLELKSYRDRGLDQHVFFYDDNFTTDGDRTKRLITRMKEEGLPSSSWSTQVRISAAEDKELVQMMAKSQCDRLYVGIESINPRTLEEFKKGQTVDQVRRGIRKFHEAGIKIHGMFMFGGETDDITTTKETVDFALDNIDTAQFLALTPAPGTPIYHKLKKAGRLLTEKVEDWRFYDGHHVVFKPGKVSPWVLQQAILEANSRFYSWSRGVKLVLKGKFENAWLAFSGSQIVKKWQKQNRDFLQRLKKLSPA